MKNILRCLAHVDYRLFIKINSLPHSRITDKLGKIIDFWYYPVILFSFIIKNNPFLLLFSFLLSVLVNSIFLKNIFKRRRVAEKISEPIYIIEKLVHRHLKEYDKYGFPSGTAGISMTIAMILFVIDSPIKFIGLIITILHGVYKPYAGTHLPSEVLGGWFFGGLIGLSIYLVAKSALLSLIP